MSFAVQVEGLGKRFVLGQTFEKTLSNRIANMFRRRTGDSGTRCDQEEFWALRDVSFEVAEGEAVGIIGGNGAGKSTLLKILSRITPPTLGRARVKGRLSSLLEVGTGFHPELTGRENILLNGAILGMRRAEVQRKFDEIVAFSGVEKFIDTPVKRYSSGMYVRLAFAVAAHLEPDVLVIDEVLAVGDADFQKRCLGKMGEVARAGRTVLFVSHNLGAVSRLCGRCLMLKHGQIAAFGATAEVLHAYQYKSAQSREAVGAFRALDTPAESDGAIECVKIGLVSPCDEGEATITTGGALTLRIEIAFANPVPYGIDIALETVAGDQLARLVSHLMGAGEFPATNFGRHLLELERVPLAADEYYISLRVTRPGSAQRYFNPRIASFIVSPADIYRSGFPPDGRWTRLGLSAQWRSIEEKGV